MSLRLFRSTRSPIFMNKLITVNLRNCCYYRPVIPSKPFAIRSLHCRHYSEKKDDILVSSSRSQTEVSTSVKETVKEATKTVSYLGVIVVGLGVTGVMLYAVLSELFSSKSPNSVYTKAAQRCCEDERVKNALGEPIQAFGEETRRGRRRHTSHLEYEKDGVRYMRMVFYLKGFRERATAHLEMKEDENGKFVYRYLFVQLDLSKRVIILEDNRATPTQPTLPSPDDFYKYPSPLAS